MKKEESGVFATINWSKDDIKTIRPRWSKKKISAAAESCKRILEDRSIELGWEVLEDALWNFQNGEKN